MENTNIPSWNLDSIFPDLESVQYKKALADFKDYMDSVDSLLQTADKFTKEANNNFDFCIWLKTYLETEDKCNTLCSTLNAYAYCVYSTDTTNTAYLNNISMVEELSLRTVEQEIKFARLLTAHKSSLEEFYKRFPDFTEYKYLLDEVIEGTGHQMSIAEEKLASDLQRTGGNAWSRLHEQIISNLKDKNGKTFNALRNDAYSPDPATRYESWEKEIELLKNNEIAFAASLNNLKGETLTLNKKRNWQEAIDRALVSSRLSKQTLNALIGAIEDSLPLWRDYMQAKAKLLRKAGATVSHSAGTDEHKGLAFYDMFAPIPCNTDNCKTNNQSLLEKTWTFEEAKNYVLKEYASFCPQMHDFAENAFNNNWIDASVHAGKVGGAYDQDFAINHESRILSNFTGTFSDIITLAHELGHAFHFSCMKGKPSAFFNYPMTLAETASTFAETIVKQDAIKASEGSDKIKLIELDLQDTCQVLIDILSRYYFEKSVFEERKNSELNAQDFCRLMEDAQNRSYGSGLNDERFNNKFTERHEYMWAVKSHYYSTDLDFYNFPYAFGQLFAAGLYQRFLKEGSGFAKTYMSLLSDTGSMSCEDLCKKAGFDISTKDFWKSGIDMYAKEIEEFKKLIAL
jgi:oligoendopeptidase F